MGTTQQISGNQPGCGQTPNVVVIESDPRCSQRGFLRTLFRLLEKYKVRYCVLHSWELLPDELPSDLDMAVHPEDRENLPFVFQALHDAGYHPAQCLNYFAKAYYFVFSWLDGCEHEFGAVDIIFEHRRSGLISLSGAELLADRQRYRNFWVAAPATEFTYLLVKRTWKKYASPGQVRRLGRLVEILGRPQAEELAGKIFPGRLKVRIVDACANGSVNTLFGEMGAQLWLTSFTRHPLGLLRFLSGEALRVTQRWLQPTGLFVVILGPDGVGKSTLVKRLTQSFPPCFRRQRVFHWRPMVISRLKKIGDSSVDPHAVPPRGRLSSTIALLAVLLDYWLGYVFQIRQLLGRSTLVVFDRYFQDLLVDPLRYRYGGPRWLPRLLAPIVPPTDLLFLVLDAEEKVILSRKSELRPKELSRQRVAYQEFAGRVKGAILVKTDHGADQTFREASRLIVEHMVNRFQHRHADWLAAKS